MKLSDHESFLATLEQNAKQEKVLPSVYLHVTNQKLYESIFGSRKRIISKNSIWFSTQPTLHWFYLKLKLNFFQCILYYMSFGFQD